MNAARLAARCVELLAVDGPVAVAASPRVRAAFAARIRVADDGSDPVAAACVFLGKRVDATTRRTTLAAIAQRLPPGAPVVVVDHNQPRACWRRTLGALALAARGKPPSRARYPAAQELQAAGFSIDRLRFADNERVQLILGHRRS